MDQLLSDLMNYVQIATGRCIDNTAVDLNSMLQTTRENLQVAIKENAAEIITEQLPVVVGQRGDYIQLFQNIIGRSQADPVIRIVVDEVKGF